jgi:predicted transposase YdaD
VIKKMERQIAREAPADEGASIWTATYVLMGLRYPIDVAQEVLRGARAMKESVTYQAIVAEGREKGLAEGRMEGRMEAAREFLLELGTKHLGRPDKKTAKLIDAIDEYEQLKRLAEAVPDVASWKELFRG